MNTIFDVAREAGVSKSTVSRVLNRDSAVKEETKIAVEQAIEKLKYTPSYFARGIRTGKTKTIAMLVPEYTNVFYNEMFRGVEDVALENGYLVLICNTERHSTSEVEYTKELINRKVDGIIYNTYTSNDEIIQYLKEISEKLPVVFMNRIFTEKEQVSYVVTDGFESTRNAVHYLYNSGRKRIAYIRHNESISVTEERYRGYLQGLSDCGLQELPEYTYIIGQETEADYVKSGKEAAYYFTSLVEKPDAVLAAIDMLAIGCIQGYKKQKYQIPGDVSIIGYDNISLSELIEPTLTTIAQPIRQLGRKAAEIIIAKIEGKKVEDKIVFEGELILRESTC